MEECLRLLDDVVISLADLRLAQDLLDERAAILAHENLVTLFKYVEQVCVEPLVQGVLLVGFTLVLIQRGLPHSRAMTLELDFIAAAAGGNATGSLDTLAVAAPPVALLLTWALFIRLLLAV